ncbi:MAG: Efflux transporter, RND family, MFP subunit [Candidatus Moranbacteria bacterium GW2011_GWE1_49_15]|nr:MAG: Efflux transporter, RND family, MFP subunit [Candidatus Moranbacteria bacterium GW2011_GWE1_49_15]
MSKSKKRIIWVIAVLAVVIGGYLIFGGKDKEAVYTTADAEKGSLSQTVSSTGDLTDEREITLNFEIGGRIGRIFVKEGQMVAAGDPIATIDNPVLSSQVSQAKAGFDLAVAQAGGTDDSIREAEVVVKNTEEVLSDTEDLNDKNISAAKKAEDDAKDYLDDAQDYYDAVVASGASSVEIKSAALTLSTAERNHNAAQKAVDVAERQAELSETNAENAVKVAKARLKTLESEFTKNSNDASVSSARASYDIALENLGKATLKSSVNGTITRINNKVGEILGTGVIKESFTKVITNDFIIESNISESDIVKVSLGDKAEVTFDALNPDDIFEGEVVQIDTDATVIQDVVYYRLKLKINNVDQR